jgi:hypothetical protein
LPLNEFTRSCAFAASWNSCCPINNHSYS